MSDHSKIEWTNATWNPVRGCRRVSPGCQHCYAERMAGRFAGPGQPYEGLVRIVERDERTEHGKYITTREPRWTGEFRPVPEKLDEPGKVRKGCPALDGRVWDQMPVCHA